MGLYINMIMCQDTSLYVDCFLAKTAPVPIATSKFINPSDYVSNKRPE